MFEIELKNMISDNAYLVNGLNMYKDKPSIFPYYIPPKAAKPYIYFYTSEYDIPLKTETKNLFVEYHTKEDLTKSEVDKYRNEIINTLDNAEIINEELGNLRIFLFGRPQIEFIDDLDIKLIVQFIIRGPLKYWGII